MAVSRTTDLLQEALALHRRGAVAEAAVHYAEVLRADPANADAHYYLAMISCQHGRFAEGAELARKSLANNPRHARAHILLGRALSPLGQQEEALASFERAIALAPDDAQAHGSRADVLSELGRNAEAIDSYDRALALTPENAEDWYNRGGALCAVGRYSDALSSFERAIAAKPAFADAHLGCAKVLSVLDRHADALEGIDKALAIEPGLADAWLGRGNALLKLRRPNEAIAAYNKALSQQADSAEAWLGIGRAFFELRQYVKAAAPFENALKLKPDFAEAWLGRGKVHSVFERFNEAYEALDKALALKPDLDEAWHFRRYVLAALKPYDKDDPACNLRITEFAPRDGSPLAVRIPGEPSGRTVKVVADAGMSPVVLRRHSWQVQELEFCKRVCTGPEPITLVDVGANMGLFSRQLLAALPTIVAAFAYEPEPQNFACLVHNLEPFRDKVTIAEAALLNKAGEMEFYLDPTNSGNFSLIPDAMPPKYFKTNVETKDVAVESAAWMNGGRRIFYKSDTEGFDELIATAILPEVWRQIFAGFIEIWRIKKPPIDTKVLASILDSFPNKIFLANPDTRVTETRVSTAEVLSYVEVNDRTHVDFGFWR